MIALIFAVNPSVSLAADSLSLRLGHGAVVNDMPVAYQSRAVTEPQREAVSHKADGGIAGTNYGDSFISPVGVAEPFTKA